MVFSPPCHLMQVDSKSGLTWAVKNASFSESGGVAALFNETLEPSTRALIARIFLNFFTDNNTIVHLILCFEYGGMEVWSMQFSAGRHGRDAHATEDTGETPMPPKTLIILRR